LKTSFIWFSSPFGVEACRMRTVSDLSIDSLAKLLAPSSGSSASAALTSSDIGDFAKLLALQINQGVAGLEGLGTSTSASENTFAALMLPASSSLGQMEAMLTLRLIEALDRLIPRQIPASEPTGLPVTGPISQVYHPGHSGVDLAVPVDTPVQATMSGKVAYAGWNTEGYGNLVIVENGPYRTYYAHLDRIPVSVGQEVEAGAVIGLSGNTGHSTGPHVHYEVRVNGTPVSPQAQA
jgi:murein DD-endopeptidase MepM/ murein hydrolase activator NlpD